MSNKLQGPTTVKRAYYLNNACILIKPYLKKICMESEQISRLNFNIEVSCPIICLFL